MEFPVMALLVLFFAVAWLAWDTLRARETANAAMRAACCERGLLFLDDTVALRSLRPVRHADGHVMLRRIYDFQYSGTGHDRRNGTITLIGDRIASLDLDLEMSSRLAK